MRFSYVIKLLVIFSGMAIGNTGLAQDRAKLVTVEFVFGDHLLDERFDLRLIEIYREGRGRNESQY